jgi:hypothetical protein
MWLILSESRVLIFLFLTYFLVSASLSGHQWTRECWSIMGMSGAHE